MRHELGHNLGMGHSSETEAYPSDWVCKPNGPMGGSPTPWSHCSEMDFRQMYTVFSDDWCLKSNWGSHFKGCEVA